MEPAGEKEEKEVHVRLEGLEEDISITAVYVVFKSSDLFTVRGIRVAGPGFEDFVEIMSFGNFEDAFDFWKLLKNCLKAESVRTGTPGSSVLFELTVEQGEEAEPC